MARWTGHPAPQRHTLRDLLHRHRQHLYVAIGDPGVIDVFSTSPMEKLATIRTEPGAYTTALAPTGDRLYAFLPRTPPCGDLRNVTVSVTVSATGRPRNRHDPLA